MDMTSIAGIEPKIDINILSPGDTVKLSVKVVEGGKERLQTFQGVVIRVHPHASGGSFTVRRIASYNVGVERTFLLQSPLLAKVEVLRHGKVRRANLYYLRGISKKAARIKERRPKQKKESETTTPASA